jgi:hypothetical protein
LMERRLFNCFMMVAMNASSPVFKTNAVPLPEMMLVPMNRMLLSSNKLAPLFLSVGISLVLNCPSLSPVKLLPSLAKSSSNLWRYDAYLDWLTCKLLDSITRQSAGTRSPGLIIKTSPGTRSFSSTIISSGFSPLCLRTSTLVVTPS